MADSFIELVKEEKETTVGDVIVQVGTLIMGGVIGGIALGIVQSSASPVLQLLLVFSLFVLGVIFIYGIQLSKPIGNAVSRLIEKGDE